jgi:hypothetical protein
MRAVKPAVLAILLAGVAVVIPAAQTAKVWTLDELFRRNIGTREDQDTAFPPHKIIGNLYYVAPGRSRRSWSPRPRGTS